jgi:hypothetical protein
MTISGFIRNLRQPMLPRLFCKRERISPCALLNRISGGFLRPAMRLPCNMTLLQNRIPALFPAGNRTIKTILQITAESDPDRSG